MYSFSDNKAKVRFDKLQSMSEAKHALKFLFANAAKVHKEKVQFQNKLGEVQDSLDDVSKCDNFFSLYRWLKVYWVILKGTHLTLICPIFCFHPLKYF